MLAVPAHGAETYTSANSNVPKTWPNQSQSCTYNTGRMDAVYFAGRQLVFFTLDSSCIVTRSLYYYDPVNSTFGYIVLFDDQRDAWFKTVVFHNALYIFWVDGNHATSTVNYRALTVDYGKDGTDWKLSVGVQKTLPAGIPFPKIRSALVMNGELYLTYSNYELSGGIWRDACDWYYVSSKDGRTFGPGTLFYTSPVCSWSSSWSTDAAAVMIPSVSDFKETMMLVYSAGDSDIYYFFFDGQTTYGHASLNTGVSGIHAVRLFTGTADGYSHDRYVVQVFCAAAGSSTAWDHIYHGQYTPSGAGGDVGHWDSAWTQLAASSNDTVYNRHEPNWAIISDFADDGVNQRMNLRIWYSRNTTYNWKAFGNGYQTINFRSSTYKSDLLVPDYDSVAPQDPGMSAYPIVGVIQGTPPYPENDGVPTTDSSNISTVVLETSQSVSFQTTWTVTAGTSVSYKGKFGPVEVGAKVSAGVKHSKETTSGQAIYQTDTLRSYNYMSYRGGLGWVLYLKPQFLAYQYIIRSYDGTPLTYDGQTGDLRVAVITYGPGTTLGKKAFYIDNPAAPMGGTDTSTAIFAGMAPMSKSSNPNGWMRPVVATDSYKIFTPALPSFSSTQGDQSSTKFVETTTDAVTNGYSAGFSVSASAFGITAEGNVNYSMDFKTTTTMTQSLGFGYAVPACGPPSSLTPCISDMTVYPYLLTPNEDDTGYKAPWMTDDIVGYQKPKPWALTYFVVAPPAVPPGVRPVKIALEGVHGTLLLNKREQNRDRLTAKLTLLVPRDYVIGRDDWLHLGFGNYFADSHILQVVSREIDGNNLVVKLTGPSGDSAITIRLSYNAKSSEIDIQLDADRIDLTSLRAYRFLEGEKPVDGATGFGVYLGSKYFAHADVDVHCAVNDQNATCNFQR